MLVGKCRRLPRVERSRRGRCTLDVFAADTRDAEIVANRRASRGRSSACSSSTTTAIALEDVHGHEVGGGALAARASIRRHRRIVRTSNDDGEIGRRGRARQRRLERLNYYGVGTMASWRRPRRASAYRFDFSCSTSPPTSRAALLGAARVVRPRRPAAARVAWVASAPQRAAAGAASAPRAGSRRHAGGGRRRRRPAAARCSPSSPSSGCSASRSSCVMAGRRSGTFFRRGGGDAARLRPRLGARRCDARLGVGVDGVGDAPGCCSLRVGDCPRRRHRRRRPRRRAARGSTAARGGGHSPDGEGAVGVGKGKRAKATAARG